MPASRPPAVFPPLPLAQGELTPDDALELKALKTQIETSSGLFCGGYKEKCLRRRLAVRMRARGVHRYGDYAALLETDPDEYTRLIDTVTINVSKFFRNPEVWEAIRELVLPELLGRDGGSGSAAAAAHAPVRMWSAGSATGEEPYTLAMLVLEHLESIGRPDDVARVDIQGTDLDRSSLAKAREASYPTLALIETPEAARARWFEEGGPPHRVREQVRGMVRFTAADLIRDPEPQDLDLILCRNLFIYFERDLQEAMMLRFVEALRPGGFLVLGKVETLLGPAATRLEVIRSRERIYRKP